MNRTHTPRERFAWKQWIHTYEATDPRWKALSREFRAGNQQCIACGVVASKGNPIDAHHVDYRQARRKPGSEWRDLRALCRSCHRAVHAHPLAGKDLLAATNAVIARRKSNRYASPARPRGKRRVSSRGVWSVLWAAAVVLFVVWLVWQWDYVSESLAVWVDATAGRPV